MWKRHRRINLQAINFTSYTKKPVVLLILIIILILLLVVVLVKVNLLQLIKMFMGVVEGDVVKIFIKFLEKGHSKYVQRIENTI